MKMLGDFHLTNIEGVKQIMDNNNRNRQDQNDVTIEITETIRTTIKIKT